MKDTILGPCLTVAELREELSRLPQDAAIRIGALKGYTNADMVRFDAFDGMVVIEQSVTSSLR